MHQPVQQMHPHQHQLVHPPQLQHQQQMQQQQQQQALQSQSLPQQAQLQQQQVVYAPAPNVPLPAPSERQAHDQFLEQNAWARPQQSVISTHGTPNFTHTPDWAEPGARHLMRNLTGPSLRTGSPFATPVSGKRASGFVDGLEGHSSALAAPPLSSRTPAQGISTGSPLQVGKHRQLNGNNTQTGERELTGFRNISSTSTIDAPLSAEKSLVEADRAPHHDGSLMARYMPGIHAEHSTPQQVFDTSQLHRHPHLAEGGLNKDMYANHSFRPAEGSYGTPTASLMSGRAPPPSG